MNYERNHYHFSFTMQSQKYVQYRTTPRESSIPNWNYFSFCSTVRHCRYRYYQATPKLCLIWYLPVRKHNKIQWKNHKLFQIWMFISYDGQELAAFQKFITFSSSHIEPTSSYTVLVCCIPTASDADPNPWIRICIIKDGSGSVWRDTNPDPGHKR